MHRSSASLKQAPSDDRAVLEGAGRGREPPNPEGTRGKAPPAAGRCAVGGPGASPACPLHGPGCVPSSVPQLLTEHALCLGHAPRCWGARQAGASAAQTEAAPPPGVRVTPGDGTRGYRGLRGCDGGERREGGAWGRSGPGFGGKRGEGPPVSGAVGTRGGAAVGAVALASPPASAIGGAGQWLKLPHSGSSHTREAPKLYTPGPPPTPASLARGWHGDRAGDKVRRTSRPPAAVGH